MALPLPPRVGLWVAAACSSTMITQPAQLRSAAVCPLPPGACGQRLIQVTQKKIFQNKALFCPTLCSCPATIQLGMLYTHTSSLRVQITLPHEYWHWTWYIAQRVVPEAKLKWEGGHCSEQYDRAAMSFSHGQKLMVPSQLLPQ